MLQAVGLVCGLSIFTACAVAQPAMYTDLGDWSVGSRSGNFGVTLNAANDVQWYKVRLPRVTTTAGFVDLWTDGPGDITDTEIGFYLSTGAWRVDDDSDGPGLASALTFGRLIDPRPRVDGNPPFLGGGASLLFNGRDGLLDGGEYWFGIGRANVVYWNAWTVTTSYTGPQRTTRFYYSIAEETPLPAPIGSLTFDTPSVPTGQSLTMRMTVTPAGAPTSTGLTVTVDTAPLGGGIVSFRDDGLGGDAVPNDRYFTLMLPISSPQGFYDLVYTIADAQGRSSNTSATIRVVPSNDFCAAATIATLGANVFDCRYATTDSIPACFPSNAFDVWFRFTPPVSGSYVFDNCESRVGWISVFDSCYGTVLGCNSSELCGGPFLQLDTLVGGVPYIIRISGQSNSAPHGTLYISHTIPRPLSGVGYQPDSWENVGQDTTLCVEVTPGTLPPSTGVSVFANLSSIGGSTNDVFYDDATHGDTTAGDNIFSRLVTLPASLLDGRYSCSFNVEDAQSRTHAGVISVYAVAPAHWIEPTDQPHDAGMYPATAQFPQGNGPLPDIQAQLFRSGGSGEEKVDMFAIRICDVQNFTATTAHPVTNLNRTVMYLFDHNGVAVQMNDDDPAGREMSWMGNSFVTEPGLYYIVVAANGPYPTNTANQPLWWNLPPTGINPPNAPSGDYQLNYWANAFGTGGFTYRLKMTGVCFPCAADFTREGNVDFFDYLDFVDAYSLRTSASDFNNDGNIDFFDYLDFVDAFSLGC